MPHPYYSDYLLVLGLWHIDIWESNGNGICHTSKRICRLTSNNAEVARSIFTCCIRSNCSHSLAPSVITLCNVEEFMWTSQAHCDPKTSCINIVLLKASAQLGELFVERIFKSNWPCKRRTVHLRSVFPVIFFSCINRPRHGLDAHIVDTQAYGSMAGRLVGGWDG